MPSSQSDGLYLRDVPTFVHNGEAWVLARYYDSMRVEAENARTEAKKWKLVAHGRCTCVVKCGDTPEESGGICKELPRD